MQNNYDQQRAIIKIDKKNGDLSPDRHAEYMT
jgi:hypothetical protein